MLTELQPMVVHSPDMTGYQPGIKARRAILQELARREASALEMPSLRELGTASGKSWRQARRHLYDLKAAGMIDWGAEIGRNGTRVTLTKCGRMAAEMVGDAL